MFWPPCDVSEGHLIFIGANFKVALPPGTPGPADMSKIGDLPIRAGSVAGSSPSPAISSPGRQSCGAGLFGGRLANRRGVALSDDHALEIFCLRGAVAAQPYIFEDRFRWTFERITIAATTRGAHPDPVAGRQGDILFL